MHNQIMVKEIGTMELCQNQNRIEEPPFVCKSKAIVKFSALSVPFNFARLQCNTDLNMPPSNWLSNAANSYGLQKALSHSSGFSSFRMAHMFPECIGEVDVVADSENIKHLLKLPYSSKEAISILVHRIGNTLLIDDFDIHKYLLRQSDDDWKWLRAFICETIKNPAANIYLKNKSRDVLQEKKLVSKFLYHSLSNNCENETNIPEQINSIDVFRQLQLSGPELPEPSVEENLPEPDKSHVYNRNVVWTFEDIRMLIGTDMPIFGGNTRPCISLRLKDMKKPINVLTGIDYWLDNLMCNVPEVLMCFHLDGIVQKYELIKTEDLPYLENSKFSPSIIRNVAQNILSFLKANATKAGHTYWLFKGKNDDICKLYDLTNLCSNDSDSDDQNPFTVPVAMLLYTVARNMKNSSEKITPKKAGSIKVLLENCIKLLPKEKYPQIVTSSHYILSDLYIPADIDPIAPNELNESNELLDTQNQNEDENELNNIINTNSVVAKNIQETFKEYKLESNWKNNSSPLPLIGNVQQRCFFALKHIAEGLNYLKYFVTNEKKITKDKEEKAKEEEKQKIIHEEQHQKMAKPFQPIPLPYETLKPEALIADPNTPIPMIWKDEQKSKKRSKNNKKKIDEPTTSLLPNESTKTSKIITSWNLHLKILLLEKACLIYCTLAEQFYATDKFGTSLKYIYKAIYCQQIVTKNISTIASQKSFLLGRAGDCLFQFAKNWGRIDIYLKDYSHVDENDLLIGQEILKESDIKIELPEPVDNIEQLMRISCICYESALDSTTNNARPELLRRLGNVRNELGVKYMHWAQEEYNNFHQTSQETPSEEQTEDEPLYQVLAKKSYEFLLKGISAFEEVKDAVNLSFVLCNMGRFMRLRAHILLKGESFSNILLQKKFYNEAFSYYQKALDNLDTRKSNPELWDLVNWELSTAVYTLSVQFHDSMDKSGNYDDLIEVTNLWQKALRFCKVETPGQRQVLYLYRAALVHYRLSLCYQRSYKISIEEARKKTILQLCRMEYEKSTNLLETLQKPKEFLEVQTDRILFQEFLAEANQNPNQKLRHLQNCLDLFIKSRTILKILSEDCEEEEQEILDILTKFENRLQFTLRSLIKLCQSKKELFTNYKKMYSVTLRQQINLSLIEFSLHLFKILEEINNFV